MASIIARIGGWFRRRPRGAAPAPAPRTEASRTKASPTKAPQTATRQAQAPRTAPKPATRPGKPPARPASGAARSSAAPPSGRHLEYNPSLDGHADPGEIVWTWVKFEDDPNQGKDRPVLVVGRDGGQLLGLMLSSEAKRDGQPNWYALGAGAWDGEHRPSWLRLDRVLDIDEDGIRREGAILDKRRFDTVAKLLRADYGWR